ncbi:MAG: hypothetical protein KJN80_09975 [Deltaproteobacteria bacterium]|nr:hypothetical protein [Deltaproteobacteria bacterium]
MNRQNKKQIMAEQISIQIIMRLRRILQEMSKHSKHILENHKITVPQLICLHEVSEPGIKFIHQAPKPIKDQFVDRIVSLDSEKIALILWSLEMLVDMLENRNSIMKIPIPSIHVTQPDGNLPAENEI